MAGDYEIVSADSHVVEPHDLWQIYTEERYRDRAPRLVHEETTDRLLCDQARLPPVGLLAGVMRKDDQVRAKGRWDTDVYPGGWDPEIRMEALTRDGVDAEVLYPTIAMQLYPIVDVDFQWALFEAYNTWLSEFVAAKPDRFFGIAMLSSEDLDRCVAETARARRLGLSGIMIPVIRGEGIQYWHRDFDPLWAAAVDQGMPVSLHAATSRDPEKRWDVKSAALSVLQTSEIQHVLLELIYAGVFDRYPDLKIVSAENDAGWAGHLLERADYWFHRNRTLLPRHRVRTPPERVLPGKHQSHLHAGPHRRALPRGHRHQVHHVGQRLSAPREHLAGEQEADRRALRRPTRRCARRRRLRQRPGSVRVLVVASLP